MKGNIEDYFLSLVKIDSESKDEKNIAQKCKEDLINLGAKVETDSVHEKTGGNTGNIYAYFPGEVEKEPIMFCAHLDTVTPGKKIKPKVKKDRITSDGTTILGSDDKSGIAEIIWAIKELKEEDVECAPIEVLLTVSEEIGLLGARYFDKTKLRSRIGFALDGHDVGKVVIGAPAQNTVNYVIHGKEAHAGVEPEKGINAIRLAAEAITQFPQGKLDEETTCNVGIIEGGKATNIVPNKVFIQTEIRSHNPEKLHSITNKMNQIMMSTCRKYHIGDFQANVEISVKKEYSSFKFEAHEEVVKLARKASERLDLDFTAEIAGGGSDANIFNERDKKILIAGSGMQNVHTVNEYILRDELHNGYKWVKEVIKAFSEE